MKIKSFFIAIAAMLVAWTSASAQFENLTRDEARAILRQMCEQLNANDASSQALEQKAGIQARVKMYIEDDRYYVLKYILPDYKADNTPAGKAFTELSIAGGRNNMQPAYINVFLGLMDKTGYDVKISYSDGLKQNSTYTFTVARLRRLWTAPYDQLGINRELARQGALTSFQAFDSSSVTTEDMPKITITLNGRWLDMTFFCAKQSFFDDISQDVIDSFLLSYLSYDTTIQFMSRMMYGTESFLGIDGIRIVYKAPDGQSKSCNASWESILAASAK